jgi:hypothetical protein
MAILFDKVSIRGLRATHFEQLMNLLKEREEEGSYYGNKEQYMKRHAEIKAWLNGIIETARDSDFRIPK